MSGVLQVMLGGAPPSDLYFEYNALLLPGNGTNGAQNNTFLDSSTNAFTITRAGNTTQGTFSPFSQTGWSNYFDGTGDYLSIADNAAFAFGSGDFTIECWVYWVGSGQQRILGQGSSAGTNFSFVVGTNSTDKSYAEVFVSSTSYSVTSSANLTKNQWNHIAFVRDGSTLRLYVNGTQDGTNATISTLSVFDSSNQIGIGRPGEFNGSYWTGYISNLRIVKGTCLYTGGTAFTPPTTPLTAVSGTSLLTCQSNRFIDNSANNFTITRNGDVSVQSFSPFNPTAAWSASTNGGSGYYDGSGDWLTVNGNTAFAFSGEYTVECWIYPLVQYTSSSGYVGFVCMLNNPSGFILFIDGVNGITLGAYGVANQIQTLTYPTARMWNHLAVSRNASNVTSVFLNGTRIGTGTFSTSYTSTSGNNLEIGTFATSAGPFTGYMSGVRLVKGTAVYDPAQTSITVPTAPLTAIANTSLLLNYTNAGIYDATSKNDLETVGNAQISTTQFKFGGSSMYFDGTGDYLLAPINVDLQMGTGAFTIEAWIYVTAAPSVGARARIYSFQNHSASQVVLTLAIFNSGGTVYGDALLRSADGTNLADYAGITPISLNTWTHLALTRTGTTGRFFVNGILQDTGGSQTQNLSQNLPAAVGAASNNTELFTGYIQDLRVTKGVARYTAAFTPPGSPFPLS